MMNKRLNRQHANWAAYLHEFTCILKPKARLTGRVIYMNLYARPSQAREYMNVTCSILSSHKKSLTSLAYNAPHKPSELNGRGHSSGVYFS